MFAIVSIKGQQFKVSPDKEYKVPLIKKEDDQKKLVMDTVLMYSLDDKVVFGAPAIKGASVEAEILEDGLFDKVEVAKFHSKKRYKRNNGHRQAYTKVRILKLNIQNEK